MFSLPVIESLIVYLGLLICLSFLAHTASQIYEFSNKRKTIAYLGVIISIDLSFSLIFGARYNVGIDQLNYKEIFEAIQNNIPIYDNIELGFYYINKILGTGGIHYSFYFFSICFIQLTFILSAFYSRPRLLPYILIVLMCANFMYMMNLMRQMTFVCFLIWLISKKYNLTFLKYSLWILLWAILWHKSAAITIFLYPLIKTNNNCCGSYKFQVLFFMFCLYLGYSRYIFDKFENFDTMAGILGYSQYSGYNVLAALDMDLRWGPRTLAKALLVLIAILMSKKTYAYFRIDPMYNSYYNLFFWGCCAEVILFGTNVISRVFLPMYFMKVVVFAYTLEYFVKYWKKGWKNFILSVSFVMLLAFDFTSILYEASEPGKSSAFQFFWQV